MQLILSRRGESRLRPLLLSLSPPLLVTSLQLGPDSLLYFIGHTILLWRVHSPTPLSPTDPAIPHSALFPNRILLLSNPNGRAEALRPFAMWLRYALLPHETCSFHDALSGAVGMQYPTSRQTKGLCYWTWPIEAHRGDVSQFSRGLFLWGARTEPAAASMLTRLRLKGWPMIIQLNSSNRILFTFVDSQYVRIYMCTLTVLVYIEWLGWHSRAVRQL